MSKQLSIIEQLRAIARVDAVENRFSIAHRGRSIDVDFTPGSTELLQISTALPQANARSARSPFRSAPEGLITAVRPLAIKLRREIGSDVRAKALEINREVQLGDPTFDTKVYINSRSDDATIRAVLADADVRAAAVLLLERDASLLVIDDAKGLVSVYAAGFTVKTPDQTRAARMLDLLAQIMDGLPTIAALPEERPPDWGARLAVIGGLLGVVGLVATPIAYLELTPPRCRVYSLIHDEVSLVCSKGPECCDPYKAGLLGGGAASVALALLFFVTVRGRSDSIQRMIIAAVIATVLSLEAGVLIARVLW